MGYRLKSGLSKTVVYVCCKDHLTDVQMPKLRECSFKKHRDTYWLRFCQGDDFIYEVCFSVFFGGCHIRLSRIDYDYLTSWEQCALVQVPFDYLQAHGLLREVA